MRNGVVGLNPFLSDNHCVNGKARKRIKPKTRNEMTRVDAYVDSPPSWRPMSRSMVAARMVMLPAQSIERSPDKRGVCGCGIFRVKKRRMVEMEIIGTVIG
jgi:hypothetical protein